MYTKLLFPLYTTCFLLNGIGVTFWKLEAVLISYLHTHGMFIGQEWSYAYQRFSARWAISILTILRESRLKNVAMYEVHYKV